MDQEPNGQCGQASEPQPEVHRPLGGAHATRGTRLWAFLVSDVPGRPCFPKRGSLSGEGVVLVGNSIRVWSKFAVGPFSWKDSRSLCVFLYPFQSMLWNLLFFNAHLFMTTPSIYLFHKFLNLVTTGFFFILTLCYTNICSLIIISKTSNFVFNVKPFNWDYNTIYNNNKTSPLKNELPNAIWAFYNNINHYWN